MEKKEICCQKRKRTLPWNSVLFSVVIMLLIQNMNCFSTSNAAFIFIGLKSMLTTFTMLTWLQIASKKEQTWYVCLFYFSLSTTINRDLSIKKTLEDVSHKTMPYIMYSNTNKQMTESKVLAEVKTHGIFETVWPFNRRKKIVPLWVDG